MMIKLTNITKDYGIDEKDAKDCINKYDFFYNSSDTKCGSFHRGTYGIPMIVFDRKTGKKYVCKKFFRRPTFESLMQETAMSKVRHKNIPKLIGIYYNVFVRNRRVDLGRDEIEPENLDKFLSSSRSFGSLFIVMEMIQGVTLYDVDYKLNYKEVFLKLFKALKYLHLKKAITHLDLSITNIIIDKKNEPFIIDFGFSIDSELYKSYDISAMVENKSINNYINLGAVYGTAPSIAQKIMNRIPLNMYDLMFSDINTLCATFYYKLSGHTPFHVHTKGNFPDVQRTYQSILTDKYRKFVVKSGISLPRDQEDWFRTLFDTLLGNGVQGVNTIMRRKDIKCIYNSILNDRLT